MSVTATSEFETDVRAQEALAVGSKDLLGRVLVACECSGRVREAFRTLGWDAWSCDIKPSEDNSPYHIEGDVLPVMNQEWDMMIAFPPCTHLAVSGAAWFEQKRKDGRQQQGVDFFMAIANSKIRRVAIENPVGIMSRLWREPDQIIQPYYFGDEYQKTTCLWLKNLPPLQHAAEDDFFIKKTHVSKGKFMTDRSGKNRAQWLNAPDAENRARTFPGIANAMANQWTIATRPNEKS
jgi:hypothetical protein